MKQRRRAARRCHVTIAAPEAESGRRPESSLALGRAQIEFGEWAELRRLAVYGSATVFPPRGAPAASELSGVFDGQKI